MKSSKFNSIVLLLTLIISCSKQEINKVPDVSIVDISSITQKSCICKSKILFNGGTTITEKGIQFISGDDTTALSGKLISGSSNDSITISLTSLWPDSNYSVRSYAINDVGIGYSKWVIFKTPDLTSDMLMDIDGNIYNSVKIGSQIWMQENLRVTHYRNGDLIPNITDLTTWMSLKSGAYCWSGNDAAIAQKNNYGAIYNYYAMADIRNICPIGWHIPTINEWKELVNYLGGNKVAGNKMKESGTSHWIAPNTGADNSSGFTALPSGRISTTVVTATNETILYLNTPGSSCMWWTSVVLSYGNLLFPTSCYIHYESSECYTDNMLVFKYQGCSIRCIKD